MRGLLDLEAGTDFYSVSGADTAISTAIATKDACSEISGCVVGAITGNQFITMSGDVVSGGTTSMVSTIQANSVALGTDTTGNYVSGITASQGILLTGTEGATVGLIACSDGQILKNVSGTSWACSTDSTGAGGTLTSADIDTSAEIKAIVTDETGIGALVFGTSPTLSGVTLNGTNTVSLFTSSTGSVRFTSPIYSATTATLNISGNAATTSQIGTLTNTKWCSSNGTIVSCTENAPAGSGDVTDVYSCASGDCNALTMAAGESFTQGSGTLTLGGTGTVEFTTGNVEFTNNQLYLGNGTGTINLTSFKRSATVFNPVAGDLIDFGKEPQGLWVTGIYGTCITASATVSFLEADGNSANAVSIDADIITNATEASDLTIYNPSIDVGDHIQVRVGTVNGSTGTLTLTASGYIKP
jgi:hypothetical protein